MHSFCRLLPIVAALLIAACDGGDVENRDARFTVTASDPSPVLLEGDNGGTTIVLNIEHLDDHQEPLTLQVNSDDIRASAIQTSFVTRSLDSSENNTSLTFTQPVGVLPIKAYQVVFIITASDGNQITNVPVTVNVQPTTAPDVYLLIGQSNMVGFSGDGTRQAGAGEADEPHERIFQLNVTPNDPYDIFDTGASWTSPDRLAESPRIIRAEDPLHLPHSETVGGKDGDYIGLGLSFAKNALHNTGANIILVPAAWSGTAFCRGGNFDANWNATYPDNENLGNTHLFDRAVARTNMALQESGGVLRGILWHQGEGDANTEYPACADLYQQNLIHLVEQLRTRIVVDGRGAGSREPDANIPFVLGTMSRGKDESSDYSVLTPLAAKIDAVHRGIEWIIPHAALSVHDDLVPANGYPCGNTSCVHFGAAALREMGARYYQALVKASER